MKNDLSIAYALIIIGATVSATLLHLHFLGAF